MIAFETNKALMIQGITTALLARAGDYDAEIKVSSGAVKVIVRDFAHGKVQDEAERSAYFSEWPKDTAMSKGYDMALACVVAIEHRKGRCVA